MDEVKMDGKSLDLTKENIETLKTLFPEVVEEGKIDFDKLKVILGAEVDDSDERYNFTWHGKNQAIRISQTPSLGTLRPCKEESVDWDNTKNLYIEGDNLEVLKLLQKSYFGKIKLIFIDPPYNTGHDFVYSDDFSDNIDHYKKITGQIGNDGKNKTTNTESDGKYHTNWLNMIYPRLKLARNLMSEDGVIFIAIDDSEYANMKKICDEIFGIDHFIASIVWQHSIQPKGYLGTFSVHHNYLLCYSKPDYTLGSFDRSDEDNKAYSNPDNDPKGPWRSGDVRNALYRPNLIYDIITPSGKIIKPCDNGWRWSKETLEEKIKTGEIIFSQDETRIIRKIYLSNLEGRVPETIWFGKDAGTTRDAMNELKELFTKSPFDTPKPTKLIERCIKLVKDPNAIVLDFFGGSSTTASAVFNTNVDDGGNRRFIIVQIPEICDEDSDAYKTGYVNIAEIGKERIRRSGMKIINETKCQSKLEQFGTNNSVDVGFRVFKLDTSNIKIWDGKTKDLQSSLLDFESNLKVEGRSDYDVIYEILLKLGLELTTNIEPKGPIYSIGSGALMICLEDIDSTDIAEKMIDLRDKEQPEIWKVVFKDNGFKSDSVKANVRETLKMAGLKEDSFITL